MAINHKNFAETTLAAAITTTGGTSITVTSEAGFPAVDFIISIDTEAMLVTNVSTTTWTVTRGYEGSTAATHTNGTAIYHNWSAGEADNQKVIKRFTAAMTSAAFATMVADMTIDVIEMEAGTYQDWAAVDISVNRSTRPLTVRPAPGAAVVWDGSTDDSTDGLFYFGNSALCSYITFDPEGTGGSFTVQNYNIGQTGLIVTAYASHVTVNGFKTRTCTESAASGTTRWSVYVASDGTHRSDNLTFNDWDSSPGTGINHFQINASASHGADGVIVKHWVSNGGNYGAYVAGDSTLVVLDGLMMMNHAVAGIETGGTATVTVRNCAAINCGANVFSATTTDGGGNHATTDKLSIAKPGSGMSMDVIATDVTVTFDGHDTDGWVDFVFKSNDVEKATLSGATGNLSIDGSLTEGVRSLAYKSDVDALILGVF